MIKFYLSERVSARWVNKIPDRIQIASAAIDRDGTFSISINEGHIDLDLGELENIIKEARLYVEASKRGWVK